MAADEPSTDRRAIGEQIAADATVTVTRYWLAEMSKIEEQIETGHGARWSILKSAMQGIVRGGR
jgi:hypothetical protein